MHILGAAKASLSKIAHSLDGAKVWNCVKFQYITRGLAGVAVRPFQLSLSGSANAPLVRRVHCGDTSGIGVSVQPVSATPLVVYRLAFGSPRSFADVD